MFKKLIDKKANRYRKSLLRPNGEVDVVGATVQVMVPVAGAVACAFALDPTTLNVSADVKEALSSLWPLLLAAAAANSAVAVLTFLAIKTAVENPTQGD